MSKKLANVIVPASVVLGNFFFGIAVAQTLVTVLA